MVLRVNRRSTMMISQHVISAFLFLSIMGDAIHGVHDNFLKAAKSFTDCNPTCSNNDCDETISNLALDRYRSGSKELENTVLSIASSLSSIEYIKMNSLDVGQLTKCELHPTYNSDDVIVYFNIREVFGNPFPQALKIPIIKKGNTTNVQYELHSILMRTYKANIINNWVYKESSMYEVKSKGEVGFNTKEHTKGYVVAVRYKRSKESWP